VQFHPELKSRPTNPHPLYRDFIAAAVRFRESRQTDRIVERRSA